MNYNLLDEQEFHVSAGGGSVMQSELERVVGHKRILLRLIAVVILSMTSNSVFSSSGAKTLQARTGIQESKQADVRELKPGPPIERQLAGGNAHSYNLMLIAGQYLHVVVEQKG